MASASVSRGRSISQVRRASVTSRASVTALPQTGHVEAGFNIQLRPSRFDYSATNVNIASSVFPFSHP
jgi:hypothetical protein